VPPWAGPLPDIADVRAMVEQLRARWPKAFNAERRPLEIGVHTRILDATGADPHLLSHALRFWTHHPVYLKALIAQQQRIDLAGLSVGAVTDEQKTIAGERLARLDERRRANNRNGMARGAQSVAARRAREGAD
jgi:sRNA-binding protein